MDAAHPALLVAEIRTLIGEHLICYKPGQPFNFDKSHLCACTLVCREWASAFRPLLWRKLYISRNGRNQFTKSTVLKYGHLIRILLFSDISLLLEGWFDNCTELTNLHFQPGLSTPKNPRVGSLSDHGSTVPPANNLYFLSLEEVGKVRTLVDQNLRLEMFSQYWLYPTNEQRLLLQNSFCSHPNSLKEIYLVHWDASIPDIQMLIDNSPALRLFSMAIGTLRQPHVTSGEELLSVGYENMRYTHQGFPILDLKQVQDASFSTSVFVGHSSGIHIHAAELTTYSWAGFTGSTRFYDTGPFGVSMLACSTWYCPQLTSIRMILDNEHVITGLPRMLATANRLERVGLEFCKVDDTLVMDEIVQKHGLHLRKLDLQASKGLSSGGIKNILTNCPGLIHFRGPNTAITVSDIVKPWVCHKLRFLSIMLDYSQTSVGVTDKQKKEEQEIYQIVYDQLARMPELVSIKFGGYIDGLVNNAGVPWSLDSGLAKLEGNKFLEEIFVVGSIRSIGVEDGAWMVEHWPRLKHVWRTDNDTNSVVTEAKVLALSRVFSHRARIAKDRSGEEFPF